MTSARKMLKYACVCAHMSKTCSGVYIFLFEMLQMAGENDIGVVKTPTTNSMNAHTTGSGR